MRSRMQFALAAGLLSTCISLSGSPPAAQAGSESAPPVKTAASLDPDVRNAHASADQLEWLTDLPKARAKAKAEGKLIFIDLYTDWCGWCKTLDRETYSDPDVQAFLNERFVLVKLDGEDGKQGTEAVKNYEVRGYPCLVVLDPESGAFDAHTGFLRPRGFSDRISELAVEVSPPVRLLKLAKSTWEEGNLDLAENQFQNALSSARETKSSRDTLVRVMSMAGDFYLNTGQFANSERLLSEAVKISKADPDTEKAELAFITIQLAMAQLELGSLEEAASSLRDAKSLAESAKIPQIAFLAYQGLAKVFERQGKAAEAAQEYKSIVDIMTESGAPPDVLAEGIDAYASCLRDLGSLTEADSEYQRALALIGKRQDLGQVRILGDLALLRVKQGRSSEAKKLCAQAKRMFDPVSRGYAKSIKKKLRAAEVARIVGKCCAEQGDLEGAEVVYKRAVSLDTEACGRNHPGYLSDVSLLGDLQLKLGHKPVAENYYSDALSVATKLYGPAHSETAKFEGLLARIRTPEQH